MRQELSNFRNSEAEKELVDLISKEIMAEIDREIIQDLMNNSSSASNPIIEKEKVLKKKKYRSIDEPWEI